MMTKAELIDKIEELYAESKLADIEALNKALTYVGIKKEEEKKNSAVIWIFAIIGVIVAVAAAAYVAYMYLAPDYLEDYEDEFDDEFDDEFFEDDDEA